MNPEALHPETTVKPRREQRRELGPLIAQTVLDLHNAGRQASRQVLMELLDLKYSVVDDHVKRLIDDGKLRRVANGIFEAVFQYPEARAISLTSMPDGYTIAEVGDAVMKLTPPEVLRLATLLAGYQMQATNSQQMREMADAVATLGGHVSNQRQQQTQLAETLQSVVSTNERLVSHLAAQAETQA